MKIKETWNWYWGIDESNIQIHSPKLEFTDFDKMKIHSAQHSFDHQWLGDKYWSNYDKVETPIDEVAEAKNKLAKIFPNHIDWVEVTGDEYVKVQDFCEPLHPTETNSSLHIHEEIYHIGDEKYRFLYAMGDRKNPNIDKAKI